ncbi:MAG: hypothetical protein GIW94_08805 [Candidatus Eremiobacteraeota bacterium]|nr:hypothetical protein [Candidatus Eremiobacteraeota bacterium]MBC5820382.1 hypothetical protein [Candidatus Eremiobacteraeota bacterium]
MALLGISACTSGNSAQEPPFKSANLTQNKLQLAVGVATFNDGSKGLNVVETFRQPNGLSAVLLSTPSLTGPFTVPAGMGGVDGGTNHITGSPQALPGQTPVVSTFGQSGGAFAYGFAPENSSTAGAASYNLYSAPFYAADGTLTSNPPANPANPLYNPGIPGSSDPPHANDAYRGGPPAYPNVRNGTFPGFYGYTLGFTTFALTPVAGTYTLAVNVPSGNHPSVSISAPNATLANVTGLPTFAAAPTFTEDGAGGGTVTCSPPAGTTETLAEIEDQKTAAYYTIVTTDRGPVSVALPDLLGPTTTGTATPSLGMGDPYSVVCLAVDYPLFEAGPPANVQQTPALTGGAGQADIAFSPPLTVVAY